MINKNRKRVACFCVSALTGMSESNLSEGNSETATRKSTSNRSNDKNQNVERSRDLEIENFEKGLRACVRGGAPGSSAPLQP